jgi:Bacterial dnaA protein helix-turn-helix
MPHLDPMPDACRSAADVWQVARATHRRRVASYEKQQVPEFPAPPPAPIPPKPPWWAIRDEVARQGGVEPHQLDKDGGRKLPIVALRQLSIALTRHLCRLSFPAIGRRYGIDHSTAVNAVRRMMPLMALLELEVAADDHPRRWVERALPLLAAHVDGIRAKYRNKPDLLACNKWQIRARGANLRLR